MSAGAFEALADPVRRRILELLAAGEQTAGTVVASLQAERRITQPAVSQHLKVLLAAELVRARSEGTRRIYSINPATMEEARAWLGSLTEPLRAFDQPLDALATEIARGKRAGRAGRSSAAGPPARDPAKSAGARGA